MVGTDADADGDIEVENVLQCVRRDRNFDHSCPWWRSSGERLAATLRIRRCKYGPSGSDESIEHFTGSLDAGRLLTNVGDKLSVTWVFSPSATTTTANSSLGLKFALVDWPEAGTGGLARITTDGNSGNGAATIQVAIRCL